MSMATSRPQPLTGITVVDFTQIYNGPYATYLMAMAGANVIKIEPPGGEHLRQRGSKTSGLPFAMVNGNKRFTCMNVKDPEVREIVLQMVERADVMVENFAPGVMARLGLGWDDVRKRNPRLVFASGSGFGSDGPYRDYPAMDLTVQAITGIMSITGTDEQPPLKAGPAICDFFGGIHLYSAIATALFERERTGQGRAVEVAMMEATFPSLNSSLGLHHHSGGKQALRTGNRHAGLAMCPYNMYPTSDGYLAIICTNDGHWRSMVKCMERPDLLTDPRCSDMHQRATNMAEVDAIIGEWTKQYPKEELFQRLGAERVPCAPIRTLNEVVHDPHLHERGFLTEIQHPELGEITVARSALRYIDSPLPDLVPSRKLGADNREVLCGWLGLSEQRFEALGASGAVCKS